MTGVNSYGLKYVASSPGSLIAFQHVTLKSWEWGWGRGYEICACMRGGVIRVQGRRQKI